MSNKEQQTLPGSKTHGRMAIPRSETETKAQSNFEPNVEKTPRKCVRMARDRRRYISLSHFRLLPSLPSDCGGLTTFFVTYMKNDTMASSERGADGLLSAIYTKTWEPD